MAISLRKKSLRSLVAPGLRILFCVALFAAGTLYGIVLIRFMDHKSTDGRPDMAVFWQAWDLMKEKSYVQISDDTQLDGALAGLAASAKNPYTVYLPKDESQKLTEMISGAFSGVGVELSPTTDNVMKLFPLEGAPAARAGVQAGDILIAIEGENLTQPLDSELVSRKIRGQEGTTVRLTISHEGKQSEVAIVRERIQVPSTEVADLVDGVTYLRIKNFDAATSDAVRKALTDRVATKGIVLDLRNNPGGLVSSATEIAGFFLPTKPTGDEILSKRVIVRERQRSVAEVQEIAETEALVPQTPLVVLVNENSASAAEILAGALRDYGRAQVLGTKTYGKGSFQQVFNLKDGSAIKLTVGNWYTPKGSTIEGTGLVPDSVVELGEGVRPSKDDAQITAALRLLAGKQ